MTSALQVREIQESDIPHICRYWADASPEYLRGMGADIALLPDTAYFQQALQTQIGSDYPHKLSYCLIWVVDGTPAGHCNVNQIAFGKEAHMHLHMWRGGLRQRGYGAQLVALSLPWFFQKLQLQRLYCEPYALNPAPNKTLEKVGFSLVKEYVTTPGALNFEQPVKLWEIKAADLPHPETTPVFSK